MSFIENLAKTVDETYNRSITENGAIGYRTTNHTLLDINFKVSSYRNRSDREIIQDFLTAFAEDRVLAMKWLFYARDAREGLGERRLFRVIISALAKQYPELIANVVSLIAEYGRYDDLFALIGTPVENQVTNLIISTLTLDVKKCENGEKNISLLAKWMPSENASSDESKKMARKFATKMGISNKEYRKMLSKLRTYIGIVETLDNLSYCVAENHRVVIVAVAMQRINPEVVPQFAIDSILVVHVAGVVHKHHLRTPGNLPIATAYSQLVVANLLAPCTPEALILCKKRILFLFPKVGTNVYCRQILYLRYCTGLG